MDMKSVKERDLLGLSTGKKWIHAFSNDNNAKWTRKAPSWIRIWFTNSVFNADKRYSCHSTLPVGGNWYLINRHDIWLIFWMVFCFFHLIFPRTWTGINNEMLFVNQILISYKHVFQITFIIFFSYRDMTKMIKHLCFQTKAFIQ